MWRSIKTNQVFLQVLGTILPHSSCFIVFGVIVLCFQFKFSRQLFQGSPIDVQSDLSWSSELANLWKQYPALKIIDMNILWSVWDQFAPHIENILFDSNLSLQHPIFMMSHNLASLKFVQLPRFRYFAFCYLSLHPLSPPSQLLH